MRDHLLLYLNGEPLEIRGDFLPRAPHPPMPTPPGRPGDPPEIFPVFVAGGDARAEIDRLLRELAPTPEAAGFRKYFYVAKADQTVVMALGRDTPLALALRGRKGWAEPMEGS